MLHVLKRLLDSIHPKGLLKDILHLDSNISKRGKMLQLFHYAGQSTFRDVVTIVLPVQTFKMET